MLRHTHQATALAGGEVVTPEHQATALAGGEVVISNSNDKAEKNGHTSAPRTPQTPTPTTTTTPAKQFPRNSDSSDSSDSDSSDSDSDGADDVSGEADSREQEDLEFVMEAFVLINDKIEKLVKDLEGKTMTAESVNSLHQLQVKKSALLSRCLMMPAFALDIIKRTRECALKKMCENQKQSRLQDSALHVTPANFDEDEDFDGGGDEGGADEGVGYGGGGYGGGEYGGGEEDAVVSQQPLRVRRTGRTGNKKTAPPPPPRTATPPRTTCRTAKENSSCFLRFLSSVSADTVSCESTTTTSKSTMLVACSSLLVCALDHIHEILHNSEKLLSSLPIHFVEFLEATDTMRKIAGDQKIIDDARKSETRTTSPINFQQSGADVQRKIDDDDVMRVQEEEKKQEQKVRVTAAETSLKEAFKAISQFRALHSEIDDKDADKDFTLQKILCEKLTSRKKESLFRTNASTSIVFSVLINCTNIVNVVKQIPLQSILSDENVIKVRLLAEEVAMESNDDVVDVDEERFSVLDFLQIIVKQKIANGASIDLLLVVVRDIELSLSDLDDDLVYAAFRNVEIQNWQSDFPVLDVNALDERQEKMEDGYLVGYFTDDDFNKQITRIQRTLRVFFAHILSEPMVKYYASVESEGQPNCMDKKLYFLSPSDIVKNFSVKFLTKEMSANNKKACQRRLLEATKAYGRGYPSLLTLVQFVSTTESFTKEFLACTRLLSNNT